MSSVVDYPALRKPRLKGGVGAKAATLIWSSAAAVAVFLGIPWGFIPLAFGGVVHTGLRWFFAQDHRIFNMYKVHELVPNNLHAGYPSHGEQASSRPAGFARSFPIQ